MDSLKRYFWLLNLVFLAAAAWLLAGATNVVVAHKLRAYPALSKAGAEQHAGRKAGTEREDSRVIIERNYFLSAMSIPVETVDRGDDIVEPKEGDLDFGNESTLQASLVGTIVADDTKWSMAMITDKTASETGAYRVRSRLMDEATVVAILTDRVVLDHNGNREFLMLQEEKQAAKHAPGPKKPAKPDKDDKLGEGIKKTGEDRYTIERGEIDKTLSNLNSIAMQARIVPSFKNGEANGFKLFAIRPGSLYSKLGIQNGDIVHKINGYAINSPDKALEIYQKLKSARSIDVELTRRGQKKSLSYSIE
ncbi:MAG: general secretion pathway protein GspC [Deltaproteobacteria bacterium]|nr:general secretion pathway protein GspC [Deltaproteobacteria bacterium]